MGTESSRGWISVAPSMTPPIGDLAGKYICSDSNFVQSSRTQIQAFLARVSYVEYLAEEQISLLM